MEHSRRMLKRPFSKATASCHFIRGRWDDPNCARCSHPPTHWHAARLPSTSSGPEPVEGSSPKSETRSCPMRAHAYRACSASRRTARFAIPTLLRPGVARARGTSSPPSFPVRIHIPYRGVTRLSFTARIERARFHCALCEQEGQSGYSPTLLFLTAVRRPC